MIFFNRPIAAPIMVVAIILILLPVFKYMLDRRKRSAQQG